MPLILLFLVWLNPIEDRSDFALENSVLNKKSFKEFIINTEPQNNQEIS